MARDYSQALTILKDNHFKITKQRKSLVEYLADRPDHYTDVTTVDQYLRELYPGMSHNTIYRNLKEFETLGIVETCIENEQLQVKYQCDYHRQHHHHFLCTNCGKVEEIEMCPIDMSFFAAQLPGAEIKGHQFQLVGLCASCAQKMDKAD